MHASEEDLALLALGERLPGVDTHVRSCPSCGSELLALASTVDTARRAELADLPAPPRAVWDRIAGELQLSDPPSHVVPDGVTAVRPTPWRRALLAGGAALTAAAAGVALVLVLGDRSSQAPSPPGRTAPLAALGPVPATGRVVLESADERRTLEVEASGLPSADGFYEVWLVDLDAGRLLALGALDDSGRGRLTVPDGVDLADYPQVDVSLEPDDGDPGHSGDSVLRGPLPV